MKNKDWTAKLREIGLFLALSFAITVATVALVLWIESKLSG